MTTFRERAREAYAKEFDRRGAAYRNTAASIRAGFENLWVTPALDALEAAMRASYHADEDDEGGGA